MIKFCNAINNKDLGTKPWRLCIGEISCIPKFQDMVLPMIGYKKNWLQWPGLDMQVCLKYKKYTKMTSLI